MAILNRYAPNNRTAKICKVKTYTIKRRNRHIAKYSWRLEHCLSINDRTNSQKISKDVEKLNNTINQQDLINIDRNTPLSNSPFFPSAFGTYTRIDHILDQ